MADAPKYPDFSQPSIMNPKYGPRIAQMLGPLIREFQRQQQFGQAFGVSPRQAIKPTPEETQRMLNVGLAFGGADITKEQKAAWEAENDIFRAKQFREKGGQTAIPVGTRVRPAGGKIGHKPGTLPEVAWEGTVVKPGTPEAGDPGSEFAYRGLDAPGPEFVAVRQSTSPVWHWRSTDSLEVLPTEQFKTGDNVVVDEKWGDLADRGMVAEPPKGAAPRPGPDWTWVDIGLHEHAIGPPKSDLREIKGIRRYAGGNWGGWVQNKLLTKKGK